MFFNLHDYVCLRAFLCDMTTFPLESLRNGPRTGISNIHWRKHTHQQLPLAHTVPVKVSVAPSPSQAQICKAQAGSMSVPVYRKLLPPSDDRIGGIYWCSTAIPSACCRQGRVTFVHKLKVKPSSCPRKVRGYSSSPFHSAKVSLVRERKESESSVRQSGQHLVQPGPKAVLPPPTGGVKEHLSRSLHTIARLGHAAE